MNTPEILSAHDRCPRAAHYARNWEANRLHPNEALRMAIETGVMSEEEDPGLHAGDMIMTLAAERGLDVDHPYDSAMHNAALADLIVTVLRASTPAWARPEDRDSWVSSAFIEPSGVRLRGVVLVDRWSKERELSETRSWRTLGECSVYGLPMTLTVVLIGQRRDGKHHSPWSKGFLHPRSRTLRIRKRSGESFGGDWKQTWREEEENISRDKWIDQMHEDGVMSDVLFDVDVPAPCPEFASKIRQLAKKKLESMAGVKETPAPNISVCHWPRPCDFVSACWSMQSPSEKLGFIHIK